MPIWAEINGYFGKGCHAIFAWVRQSKVDNQKHLTFLLADYIL